MNITQAYLNETAVEIARVPEGPHRADGCDALACRFDPQIG
jgi:hypothetical protein